MQGDLHRYRPYSTANGLPMDRSTVQQVNMRSAVPKREHSASHFPSPASRWDRPLSAGSGDGTRCLRSDRLKDQSVSITETITIVWVGSPANGINVAIATNVEYPTSHCDVHHARSLLTFVAEISK